MIPAKNVWHPLGRKPAVGAPPAGPPLDADVLPEPEEFDEEPEPDALDEADELAAMSDQDFYRQMRADIEGVREGTVSSIHDTEHKVRQMRPWSKRRHPRDRYGNRLY